MALQISATNPEHPALLLELVDDAAVGVVGGLGHHAPAAIPASRSGTGGRRGWLCQSPPASPPTPTSGAPVQIAGASGGRTQTGRVGVTHEASDTRGLGADIVAGITDRCFFHLEAAPQRVTGFDVPYPPAKLEEHFLPDLDRMLDAVDRVLGRREVLR